MVMSGSWDYSNGKEVLFVEKQNIGKNVEIEVDGKQMVITIDLTKDFGLSKSGKTTIVATSGGNQTIDTPGAGWGSVKLGLNCYR